MSFLEAFEIFRSRLKTPSLHRVASLSQRRSHRITLLRGLHSNLLALQIHTNLRVRVGQLDGLGDGADAVAAAHGGDVEFHV